jgi:hypothetical protein
MGVCMRKRLSANAVFCIGLLAIAINSSRASAQSFFLTPIPNQPFSAVVNTEQTLVHADSITQLKSKREVARDSQGRIHNEFRSLGPTDSNTAPKLLKIHLYDPQTRISTQIDVPKRTFWTRTMDHPPSTEPPSIRFAAPDGNAPPSDLTKQEDLGVREIDGVPAHGLRQTQTVTDGGKEVVITDEDWYSQELRVNLITKHNDPRTGSTTLTLSQINRSEPDPALFVVPQGYNPPKPEAQSKKTN